MSSESVLWIDKHTEPLREKAVKAVREGILSQHLKPGQRLVERDLCAQTGVSRSSIREALRYLESEGLIERIGTKGMFVTVPKLEKAMEIYEVRAALEAEAAKHFSARASEAELQSLKSAWQSTERASRSDPILYGKEIDRFYEILFAGAKNETAQALIRPLRARINLMRNATILVAPKQRIAASVAQMKLIVDALELHDAEAAASACRRYVARSVEFAKQYFQELHEAAKAKENAATKTKRSATRGQ